MDSTTKDSAERAGPQMPAQQGSTGTSTPMASLEGASSVGEPIIDGDDQEFGSFVQPQRALLKPRCHPTLQLRDPLGALESLKPPQQKHNLIDEIMEYERNPSSLFTDEKAHSPRPTTPATSTANEFSKIALPSQPQPVTALEEDPKMTAGHRVPSPAHPPAFDPILDPLLAAQNIQTPEPGSGLTPAPMPQLPPLRSRKSVEPTAKGGGVAIEKNLGLIDQDYFASREPAEAIPIVTTPLASTGLSTPRGDSQPPRSPGWSLKSMISSQLSSPSHSREHTREPSSRAAQEEHHVTTTHHHHHHHHHHRRQPSSPTLPHVLPAPPILTPGVNRDLLDLDLVDEHSDSLPTPHPLDLPTPVPVPPSDPDQWLDVPQSQSTRGSPSAQSYGTLSRIPSWIGSLLGGATGESEDTIDGPHSKTRRDSDSSTTSSFHSDRRTANAYGASPSPIPTPDAPGLQPPSSFSKHNSAGGTPSSGGYEHVHGQRGRPLPRARPSLESVQQLYSSNHNKSRSRSRPSHSPVARQREAQHEPVNITHSTPFAPSPPAGASSLATPYSAPLNVGFSPMVKSHTLPTTAGPSSSANPFGTPTFTPIPGAPGFKPNEYDWDKGFSDELEQEMRGNDYDGSRRPRMPKTPEDDSTSGGLGSIFGFGSFRQKSSSDRVHSTPPPHLSPGPSQPYAYGHSRTATEPTQSSSGAGTSGKDRLMYATSRPIQKSNSRGSTVPTFGLAAYREEKLADLIRPHLPPLSRLPKSWTLLYSLDQHGISLNTLYNNCEAPLRNRKHGQNYVGMGGVLLVLRHSETSEQSVDGTFGAFIAEGLGRKSKGFFGGGDSFLWKYSNGALQVFKASGRNTYFAICESGYMAFGGGSTSYGLYIDSGLLEGYSAPSVTFGNETLCNPTSETLPSASRPGTQAAPSQQSSFECVGLEVWGVGPT
ncbi:TLD-domain-containing protein [Coprinopsis sp. MPI-PUGE-AT-0042]|nr:TLD-domain-containing protein [Coprinopsis sp. MPI-PUGE-AT-0042]